MKVTVQDTNKYVSVPNLICFPVQQYRQELPSFLNWPGGLERKGIGSFISSSLAYEKYSDENPPLDC